MQNGKPRPDNIDILVGRNIKKYRKLRTMTQKILAKHIGITYQQIQKYENGINRISASNLYKIAIALDISLDDMFSGLEEKTNSNGYITDFDYYTIKIIDLLKQVDDKILKKNIINMLKNIVEK